MSMEMDGGYQKALTDGGCYDDDRDTVHYISGSTSVDKGLQSGVEPIGARVRMKADRQPQHELYCNLDIDLIPTGH